ncbi:MAG: class I SAM-dependent methyltransferase [Bryobacteraceae bacterium]
MLGAAEAGATDSVLDVACGPGVVVCAFAEVVRHATGIDLTPAMLQQARQLQAQRNLTNVDWVRGDVTELPFRDRQFSVVTSRFVFHHLPDPALALKEMVRVSKAGGRIIVADSAPAAEKADAFNSMERLRDPSHGEALPIVGLSRLFAEAGLEAPRVETMRLEGDLESLFARSFPKDGDADRIRTLFEDSRLDDRLDMAVRRENGRIVYAWPLAIVTARRQ